MLSEKTNIWNIFSDDSKWLKLISVLPLCDKNHKWLAKAREKRSFLKYLDATLYSASNSRINNAIFWNLILDIRTRKFKRKKSSKIFANRQSALDTNFQIAKAEENLNLSLLILKNFFFYQNKQYVLCYFSQDKIKVSYQNQQTINLCINDVINFNKNY